MRIELKATYDCIERELSLSFNEISLEDTLSEIECFLRSIGYTEFTDNNYLTVED